MAGLLCGFALTLPALAQHTDIWDFSRVDQEGGHSTVVLGHPQIIQSPYGPAVQFDGMNDGIFLDVNPLSMDATWTWEVIFRPDAGGPPAQRFFHLQEVDPSTGADTKDHMTLEIRIVDGKWCLDSFAVKNGNRLPLLNCKLLHPLGNWYRVTFVYDGTQLRNYVGEEMQGAGAVHLAPSGPGRSSVGVRINKTYYFKGVILKARFTPRALPPAEFLKLPRPSPSH
jgi:hypothetical protein